VPGELGTDQKKVTVVCACKKKLKIPGNYDIQ